MAQEPIDYVKFADECERLAMKQPSQREAECGNDGRDWKARSAGSHPLDQSRPR
jgi:hypothetical protein